MKIFKWALFFLFAFGISFIVLRTFSQEAFRYTASVRVLGSVTPLVPIYYYVIGAFGTGLVIGLLFAVYIYVTHTVALFKKSRQIRDLENQIDLLNGTVSDPAQCAQPDGGDASAGKQENAKPGIPASWIRTDDE